MASAQAEATLVGPGARADETAVAVPRQSRRRRLETGLFVLPAVLFQLCWGWYPLVAAFLISFTNARIRGAVEFTGLESYSRMWHDPLTVQAFRVTAIYAALTIILTFVVPIIVAILLMEMPRHVMRWMMLSGSSRSVFLPAVWSSATCTTPSTASFSGSRPISSICRRSRFSTVRHR